MLHMTARFSPIRYRYAEDYGWWVARDRIVGNAYFPEHLEESGDGWKWVQHPEGGICPPIPPETLARFLNATQISGLPNA